jgi:hypothetical protein
MIKGSKSISVVLNCHREGKLLQPSLVSVVESLRSFDHSGGRWELLCVLDRSDAATEDAMREAIARYNSVAYDIRVMPVDFGDLATSRNYAVNQVAGGFVALVDGDDLVSRNWFSSAYECARRYPGLILHPECNLYFGSVRAFMVHRNQEAYDLRALFFHNLWTALSFAPTEIYRGNPYLPNSLDSGFGYEDWHWNCETISRGMVHRMVAGTCHFIRVSEGSLSRKSVANDCLIRPTALWRHLAASNPYAAATESGGLLPSRVRGGMSHLGALLRKVTRTGPHPLPPDATLGERLYWDPGDLMMDAMPEWVCAQLHTAATDDPAVDMSGVVFNFSPILPNPFAPCLSNSALATISETFGTLFFVDSPAALSRINPQPSDLVVLESGACSRLRTITLSGLKARIGQKHDLFLATLIVQSLCRRLVIHDSLAALGVLRRYWNALNTRLSEILYYESRPCPAEWDRLFEQGSIVRKQI